MGEVSNPSRSEVRCIADPDVTNPRTFRQWKIFARARRAGARNCPPFAPYHLLAPRVLVLTPTRPIRSKRWRGSWPEWRPTTPLQSCRAKAAEFEAELRRSTDGRFEGLRRLARYIPEIDRRKLVVLVDQFEEIYTLCSEQADQNTFVGNLLHAASDVGADVSVVLTLRTDFIGNTQRHPALNQLVTELGIIVPAMDAAEVREAITKPAAYSGRRFDPALVELLVQDTVGRDGALPLLQFALQRLWDAMREGKDPAEAYKDIGGVGGALAQEADQLYDTLAETQQKIVRRAFRSMVQLGEGIGDTRRRVDLNTIVSKDTDRDEVLNVLRTFAQPSKRLVTLEGEGDGIVAEVTHEALIARWGKIHDWLGPEQREEERFHRKFAESAAEWDSNRRVPDLLWRGLNLKRLRQFASRTDDDLTELEHSFLAASVAAEEREERKRVRRLWLAWASALAIAAVCVFVSWELYYSRYMAGHAQLQITEDLDYLRTAESKGGRVCAVAPVDYRGFYYSYRANRDTNVNLAKVRSVISDINKYRQFAGPNVTFDLSYMSFTEEDDIVDILRGKFKAYCSVFLGSNFSREDFASSLFRKSIFINTNFSGSRLEGSHFDQSELF